MAFNTSYISSNTPANYTATPAAGSSSFNSCIATNFSYTFNSGSSNLLKLIDIITNNKNYYIANVSLATVKLRRVNNAKVTGSRNIVSMESTLTSTAGCPSSKQIILKTPYQDVMESFLNTNYINQGTDNIFTNTGNNDGNNNNIERVDVIFPNGLSSSFPNDVGFAVFDRGVNNNHDGFRIAAITSVDANNDPASFGTLKNCVPGNGTNNGSWGHPTTANGNKTFAEYVLRKEETETQLKVSSVVNQQVGGVLFSFTDLGIGANQKIYGYSIIALDGVANPTSAQMLDINNATVYPTNTTETNGGLDMMAISAVFETSSSVLSIKSPELNAKIINDKTMVSWKINNLDAATTVHLEESNNGVNFSFLYNAPVNENASAGVFYDSYNGEKKFYRLLIKPFNEQAYYSIIISIVESAELLRVYPTLLHANEPITIEGLDNGNCDAIFTLQDGKQFILKMVVTNQKAVIQNLPSFVKGMVCLNFKYLNQKNSTTTKLIIE